MNDSTKHSIQSCLRWSRMSRTLFLILFLKQNQKRQEATFDERMSSLVGMRSNLTARKGMLETQLRDLDARIQERQKRAAEGSEKGRPNGEK